MITNKKLSNFLATVFFFSLAFSSGAHSAQLCEQSDAMATTPAKRFQLNNNGTLVDTTTGLMWQHCLVGQSSDNCLSGEAKTFTWAEALTYLSKEKPESKLAGYSDWRIPNIRELASIIELRCSNPAINLTLFPNNGINHVWSSSPYKFYSHYSWYLDFADGIFIYGDRQDKKLVRLVRDAD